MNINLSGKAALVCGSSQGLGLASAIELSLLGAHIILMARNADSLKEAIQKLDSSQGQQHDFLVADFSNHLQVEEVINQYINTGKKIDILVNNTGGPAAGLAIDANSDDFLKAFHAHLICNQILVKATVNGMKESGYGRIINIISTSVLQPIAGLGVSNTIRAAVANWSKTLSIELGSFGITVNNVLPGFMQTVRAEYIVQKRATELNMKEEDVLKLMLSKIPVGRAGDPSEFGAAVAFLASPAGAYINGVNLPVDGGRTGWL